MKKLIWAFILTAGMGGCINQAVAEPYGHHGYWRPYNNNGWIWVAPTVIGGVIGYEIAKQQPPVIVQQPAPVIIQQQAGPVCSPWTEVQNPDNTITRTRTCTQ